jgi:hypothetical protein
MVALTAAPDITAAVPGDGSRGGMSLGSVRSRSLEPMSKA